MFTLTVSDASREQWIVKDVYTFTTADALIKMLNAYGVAPRYYRHTLSEGTHGADGIHYAWNETTPAPATRTRKHTYCGGAGTIITASGAPATCMGCSGTGRLPMYDAAQRASIQRTAQRHMNAQRAIKAYAATLANRVDNVEYMVTSGLDHLHMREPHRMEKLYASVENGRVSDVVRALYDYRAQAA